MATSPAGCGHGGRDGDHGRRHVGHLVGRPVHLRGGAGGDGHQPDGGAAAGGTSVTITGTNLAGATAVEFGSTAATITSDTATQIVATSPAGDGHGERDGSHGGRDLGHVAGRPVHLRVGAGGDGHQSDLGSATAGATVTITGTNLANATAVKFGNAAATITSDTATQIVATSPAGSGTVDVTVVTAGGTSATSSADEFTYMAVTGVSPAAGPLAGGTSVTITGTGFTGATAVKFGSTAATITSDTATQIMATSPAGSGTVDITVTGPGGTTATSSADQFTYVAAPTVTGISPTSGPTTAGVTVTITGTNLANATAVKFGNAAATITSDTATQIVAMSPAGSGTVDVTVVTAGGTSATSSADQFTYLGTGRDRGILDPGGRDLHDGDDNPHKCRLQRGRHGNGHAATDAQRWGGRELRSGSGTATLSFSYVVAAGQGTAKLDYASTAALALNGGSIQDALGNAAVLTLPATGTDGLATRNIVIQTIAADQAVLGPNNDTAAGFTIHGGVVGDTYNCTISE